MNFNFFEAVIQSDFAVAEVIKSENGALFCAKRKDLWHFVRAVYKKNNDSDENCNIRIRQFHIPRFLMADAINSIMMMNDSFRQTNDIGIPLATTESDLIEVYSLKKGSYDLNFFQTKNGLPEEFCQALEEDINLLEKANSKVICQDGLYILPNEESYTGLPVSSRSEKLIQAISFEKEYRKALNARNFGIYSAFCTWKDFVCDQEISRSTVEDIVLGQLEYDANKSNYGDFMPLAMRVQSVLFRKPIWGKGISMEKNEAVDITYEAIQKLYSTQWAQFNLMNGMHEGGLFLPLAQVLNLNSWETYIEWKTQGFQPDSAEEQEFRVQTMFIKMLGDIGESD